MFLLSSVKEAESMSRKTLIADLKRAGVWVERWSNVDNTQLRDMWLERWGVKELEVKA